MNWPLVGLVFAVLIMSILMLYSAGTGPDGEFGGWRPFALSQMGKIALGLLVLFFAALTDIKKWLQSSYLLYAGALGLVIAVTFFGDVGMGAQRWLNLGFMNVQPSELIKIGLVLALARNFAWQNSADVIRPRNYIVPLLLTLIPFAFIVAQPDLGTALSLGLLCVGMFFIVGAPKKWFIVAGVLAALAAPIVWTVGLHDYQRERVMTFIDPSRDPRGAGYQINQAKIAFGSGGIVGRGYTDGTQSQLSFLPEKQTDFIFTMLGEELGMLGATLLLILYTAITGVLFWFAKTCRNRFGQLLCFGFMLNFFIYYFINILMVLGLLPTVGVPLPLMSFGGSSLLSLMFGFGLAQNAHINKDQQLSAKGY
jgi:rod shape determining protein RodA